MPRRAFLSIPWALLGLAPALAVWGLGRAERDRPGWFLRAAGSPVTRAPAPRTPRLVLAAHYPWYGTPGGPARGWRHWNHARRSLPSGRIVGFHDPRREGAPGRLDLGATHYPAAGPYDSRDPAVIRRQIGAARVAGLDGFVVSWWGRESAEAETFGAILRETRDPGFRLAPYYEAGELWPRGGAGVAADLGWLLDRHGSHPALLRVGDTPVVFVYGAHRLRPDVWQAVRSHLARRGHQVYLVASESRQPGWLAPFDALHVYSPVPYLIRGLTLAAEYRRLADRAAAAGVPFVPAVAPGFDDRRIREPGTVVNRAGGATYEATWEATLAVAPSWVLVTSWNEWHEGSEIEESLEHGTRYLELTRRWADTFRGGAQ